VFILGIPPRLAAVWFGPKQVSTACAAGVFGNQVPTANQATEDKSRTFLSCQLGIAVGFMLPPWLVHMGSTERVSFDLTVLFLISAVINSICFVFILLFFAEKPPLPPSIAQMQAIEESRDNHFFQSIKKLLFNPNYMLLLITYGSTPHRK
jgi:MFS transporter, FLVCR family, feline leukemia virus subgroup C receptor-related protein